MCMVTPKNSLNLLFAMKSLPSDKYEFKSNEAIWGYGQFFLYQYRPKCQVLNPGHLFLTRTTNVVRNAGYAHSRYTLKLSLKFFFNESMNQ